MSTVYELSNTTSMIWIPDQVMVCHKYTVKGERNVDVPVEVVKHAASIRGELATMTPAVGLHTNRKPTPLLNWFITKLSFNGRIYTGFARYQGALYDQRVRYVNHFLITVLFTFTSCKIVIL